MRYWGVWVLQISNCMIILLVSGRACARAVVVTVLVVVVTSINTSIMVIIITITSVINITVFLIMTMAMVLTRITHVRSLRKVCHLETWVRILRAGRLRQTGKPLHAIRYLKDEMNPKRV